MKRQPKIRTEQGNVSKAQLHEILHDFRKGVDEYIQRSANMKQMYGNVFGREMALVHTKLQEAKMWAGKCLEAANAPFPEELRDEATPTSDEPDKNPVDASRNEGERSV